MFSDATYGKLSHTNLLLEEILGSFAEVTKQREKVSGHVKLKLSCPTFTEVIRQDHLQDKQMRSVTFQSPGDIVLECTNTQRNLLSF